MERPLTGAERARKWRAAMRAKGLRPRTFWVADTSTDAFKEQARRDSEKLTRWQNEHSDVIDEMLSLQYWPLGENEGAAG